MRPKILESGGYELQWERIYVLTLLGCFWIAAAEIIYFWL